MSDGHDSDRQRQHTRSRLVAMLAAAALLAAAVPAAAETLLSEDFETVSPGDLADRLGEDEHVAMAAAAGPEGSTAIEVSYEGYERGSQRVLANLALEQRTVDATLSYDVRFCPGFQFVKGGKLHGLAPDDPVTGGNEVDPETWSARVVFGRGGKLGVYVYSQGMDQRYGDSYYADDPVPLEPGRFYSVSLHVRLNDPGELNGRFELYVDGERTVARDGIAYRGAFTPPTEISTFLFSAFHGGSGESWAPRTPGGDYAVECAVFDNFEVSDGLAVR